MNNPGTYVKLNLTIADGAMVYLCPFCGMANHSGAGDFVRFYCELVVGGPIGNFGDQEFMIISACKKSTQTLNVNNLDRDDMRKYVKMLLSRPDPGE